MLQQAAARTEGSLTPSHASGPRCAFLKHRGVCGEERGQDLSDFVVPSPDEGADLVRGTAALKCSQCWACGLRDLEGKEEGAAEVMQGVRREGICQHNRQTSLCRECGGSSICQHNRQRSACEECECEVCVCVQIRKGRLDAARSRGALKLTHARSCPGTSRFWCPDCFS